MFERARATFKLKAKQRCPGETYCTEDPRGFIAKQNGATLETHCNKTQCDLFFTNAKSIPAELLGYFDAACRLRGKDRRNLEKRENDLPFWAIWAYEVAETVYDQVQAEMQDETDGDGGGDALDIEKGGDSDAFALVEEFMQRNRRKANG